MKTTLIVVCVLASFSAFCQSSVLIEPNGSNGIFSKNNTTVTANPGTIQPPAIGEGTRLMWIPAKSAFRAGTVAGTHWNADSIGVWSTAFGYNAVARGYASTASGFSTNANGYYATALGLATNANGSSSTALGYSTAAIGGSSTALGYNTNAKGNYSTASGFSTTAAGNASTAWGYSTTAAGNNSIASGYLTTAGGLSSSAWGDNTTADGNYSTAWGNSSKALGVSSSAWGDNTTADGNNSTAWGNGTTASGTGSTVWGYLTKTIGNNSTAWGNGTTASGTGSTVWGYLTKTIGLSSTAWGNGTTANGDYSTAMGAGTTTNGLNSVAMGSGTFANGISSVAMGAGSVATGSYSVAMGSSTNADGINSTALGYFSTASGDYSTSWGEVATAAGKSSTAWGYFTAANGYASTALGVNTTAQPYGSFVLGRYNIVAGTHDSWVNTEPLFVIGNGSAANTRSNAVTVLKNGRVGIGTATPDAALHITGTATSTPSTTRAYFNVNSGTAIVNNTNVITGTIKVHADGNFWADGGGFIATSDARIKHIIGQSNSAEDLDKLTQIAVTDYIYIDEVNHGNIPQKKVIAQQLKTILPAAVSQNKGFIPYLYQNAQQVSPVGNTTHIRTEKAHGLVNGDVVKLIVENQGEKHLAVSVLDAHTFSVKEILQGQVFVYGKQVEDLHHVDYDAVSMLNVSATQELTKQIEIMKQKNQELEAKITEVEALKQKNNELEAKMGKIDAQMVSLKNLLLKTDNQTRNIAVNKP